MQLAKKSPAQLLADLRIRYLSKAQSLLDYMRLYRAHGLEQSLQVQQITMNANQLMARYGARRVADLLEHWAEAYYSSVPTGEFTWTLWDGSEVRKTVAEFLNDYVRLEHLEGQYYVDYTSKVRERRFAFGHG